MLKGVAILCMVCLHLFNRVDTDGFYRAYINIGNRPLVYYLSFACDLCVPLYAFLTGYGLYIKGKTDFKGNAQRILKLLVRFWLILVLTCAVGLILKSHTIPGSFIAFLGNAALYDISYVGAWWYMATYTLLVLVSPWAIKLVKKLNPFVLVSLSLVIYAVAYYFRIMNPLHFEFKPLDIIATQAVLFGTTWLPFAFGMLFYKYKIISLIRNKLKCKALIGWVLVLLVIIGRSVVKSMVAAPFTAFAAVLAFSLIPVHKPTEKLLCFFGKHSTNIWLLHMQIYMTFFSAFVFHTNTVPLCLLFVLGLSVAVSFVVEWVCKPIINGIQKQKKLDKGAGVI